MTEQYDIDKVTQFYFHTPEDVAQSYAEWAEEMASTPGLTWGVKSIDAGLLSLRPGNRLGIVARPGHGKSTILSFLLKRQALDILSRDAENEAVYYVSWDQPAEENDANFQAAGTYSPSDMMKGRVPISLIRTQAAKRLRLPIYHIGVSRRHKGVKRPPKPTMDQVVEMISNYQFYNGIIPKLVVLDYIQKVPGRKQGDYSDRTAVVTEAIFNASNMAMDLDCPLAIGVQAGRGVKDRRIPIPTMEDAQWASALEQETDRLISLWMPIRDLDPAKQKEINISGTDYEITENLLAIRNLKQRFEQGYGLWPVHIDIPRLEIKDFSLRDTSGYYKDDDHHEGFDLDEINF